ncbi:SWIM zinc finger family protein [Phormidium yuhuli AB48]|uniref:SWIM zinc finger family protein n=1 Tax=Phormidium yuhuli AB48 TaxID=2940671 RepID=A0ABY5AKS9_9CYAN|nr:SWIM zinc finger family protein [Phormidium yuhuli]USR89802.1 SWIM zinc finger family protein [Phormidium yuhuli AB48]
MVYSGERLNPNQEQEWWVQQWLDLLQKYRFKKRLERGRNYARQGNVLGIEFRDKKVLAKVQGSEDQPYELSIWLDAFSDEDWQYVVDTLSEQALHSAKLLAGEMPTNIEDVFAANGLRLFPFSLQEVRSRCSCPDKANPCKHIIAVYHLLGDRFGEDPFLLFQLRGRSKEEIIAALRERRADLAEALPSDSPETPNTPATSEDSTQGSPLRVEDFWTYDDPLDPSLVVITPPPTQETVLDVLGPIPLLAQTGNSSLAQTAALEQVRAYFQQVYQTVSQEAIAQAMATPETD